MSEIVTCQQIGCSARAIWMVASTRWRQGQMAEDACTEHLADRIASVTNATFGAVRVSLIHPPWRS